MSISLGCRNGRRRDGAHPSPTQADHSRETPFRENGLNPQVVLARSEWIVRDSEKGSAESPVLFSSRHLTENAQTAELARALQKLQSHRRMARAFKLTTQE